LEDNVLALHYSGLTHAEIAKRVQLERSTITKMIPRIKTDVIWVSYPMNRSEELVFLEYRRLDHQFWALREKVVSDDGKFRPKHRHVREFAKVGGAIAQMLGIEGWDPRTKSAAESRHARLRQLRAGRPSFKVPQGEDRLDWIADQIAKRDDRARANNADRLSVAVAETRPTDNAVAPTNPQELSHLAVKPV